MSFLSELRRRNVFRVAIAYSVTGWLVAQIAELALDSFGAPDWVMKTILLLMVLGLPFAVLFAWAFEMTPEGLRREKDVDRSQSITRQTGQKLNLAIIGMLTVALVFSMVARDWGRAEQGSSPPPATTAEQGSGDKSIAVLPFVNMSQDPENEYFSDGISEELLNVLVKVEGLRVASRTSAFSFKGKGMPIPEIAAALKVDHVLEGSVRKAGETVRVTAQLIDVKTDSHLWSETYDRKLEDIFVIQDEISAHIVEALKVALGTVGTNARAEQATQNLEAYEYYLRGRHFWQRRGEENIRKAIELLRQATDADPGFARAWSSLGAAHLTMPNYSREPEDVHYPLALDYAEKALRLDPTISDAHAVLGDLLRFDRRWGEAEEHYLRAIELEPRNSTAYLWYTEHLCATGRLDEALKFARKGFDLDPFHPGTNSMLAFSLASLGETDEALRYLRAAWELGHPSSIYQLLEMEMYLGDTDEALRLVSENPDFFADDPDNEFALFVEARTNPESHEKFLDFLETAPDAGQFWIGIETVLAGRVDDGIARILQTEIDGGEWLEVWRVDLAALRRHPRFGEVLQAGGLPDFWNEVGWPAQCSRNGERITCD